MPSPHTTSGSQGSPTYNPATHKTEHQKESMKRERWTSTAATIYITYPGERKGVSFARAKQIAIPRSFSLSLSPARVIVARALGSLSGCRCKLPVSRLLRQLSLVLSTEIARNYAHRFSLSLVLKRTHARAHLVFSDACARPFSPPARLHKRGE